MFTRTVNPREIRTRLILVRIGVINGRRGSSALCEMECASWTCVTNWVVRAGYQCPCGIRVSESDLDSKLSFFCQFACGLDFAQVTKFARGMNFAWNFQLTPHRQGEIHTSRKIGEAEYIEASWRTGSRGRLRVEAIGEVRVHHINR
ncbi:hypothetical protein ACLB2K_020104 [Fragaria x ananassa]